MTLVGPMPAMRVYDSATDFQLLEEGWKSLFSQHGGWNVFLSWQWFHQWWAAFGTDHRLRLLTLSQGGRLVGIVPAMIEVDGSGRRLTLIGSDRTTDYGDLLVAPESSDLLIEAFADFVVDGFGEYERVELRSLPAWSPLVGPFREALRRRGIPHRLDVAGTCPTARLAPTWDEYLATLGKHDRHELRRKMRRAAAAGVQRMVFLSSPGDVSAGLESFFRLHRASAEEKAAFLDETMVSFFRGVSLAFAEEGWLRLGLMKLDERDVAASLSFSLGDRVMLYNSGLDPEYRASSVGIALHAAEMQEAIKDGKLLYDFLRGNEPYKYRLGAQDTDIYTLTVLQQGGGVGDGGNDRN